MSWHYNTCNIVLFYIIYNFYCILSHFRLRCTTESLLWKAGQSPCTNLCGYLLENLHDRKYHHIYMDNYFLSVTMFREFLSKYSPYCCGKIRKNRRLLPKNLMAAKHKGMQERGSAIFSRSSNLLLIMWRDRKIIHVLSSLHGSQMKSCTRNIRDKKR